MQLIGEARDGEIRLSTRQGMAVVECTYSYIIQADSANQSRLDVIAYSGLPSRGDLMPDGITVAKNKSARRRPDKPTIWDVQVQSSSEVDEDSDQSSRPVDSNPKLWVPERETMYERVETIEFTDRNGNAAKASNGEWYQTGFKRRRFLPVWEFWQFESASLSDEDLAERNETVNDAEYKGRDPKTLLLTIVKSTIGRYYGVRRRLTNYRLVYNSKTWLEKRIDYGSFYWETGGDPPSGDKLRFVDSLGAVLSTGLLDGSGGYRDPAEDPLFNEFDVYEEKHFPDFLRI